MPTRILIADDNHAVRTALRHLLEGAGVDQWEIVEAEDGLDTIVKAQEFKPNLIILDLVMPGMDGLAAARELSRLLPEIPLLMHALHHSPQLELEAQKVGVRRVVPKADTTSLVSAIRQFLTPEPSALIPAGPENVPSNIAAANVGALPQFLTLRRHLLPTRPRPSDGVKSPELARRPDRPSVEGTLLSAVLELDFAVVPVALVCPCRRFTVQRRLMPPLHLARPAARSTGCP